MSAAVQERGSSSNQYELLARLAEGGMAEIFLARGRSLAGFERHVVLKRIRPERGEDPRWVQMFLDEARLAAQLNHPNIAQVFDLGRIGEAYFYTMEYVHGEDTRSLMSRTAALGQRVPLEVSLAIAVATASGLAHAHERCGSDGQPLKIVHRDVSPSNIMVSYEGVVKVLDFGVAKARSRSIDTEAGTLVGKTSYMSPEQVRLGEIDHRSDVFSLGVVLYELLTQSRLFRRQNDYETLAAVVRYEPPLPSSFVDGIPPELDQVVMRALAKDPAHRFPTAATMLEALEAVGDLEGLAMSQREVRRYMRELYGTRPEPWRELELREQAPETYSGEVVGPLTRTVFPIDVSALDVPLLTPRERPPEPSDDLVPTPMLAKHHTATPPPKPPATPRPTSKPAFLPPPETLLSVRPLAPVEVTHDVVPLPAPPRSSAVVVVPAPRKSRSALVVILTAVIVAGLVIGVYALRQRDRDASASGAAAPRPPVTPAVKRIESPPPAPAVVTPEPTPAPAVVTPAPPPAKPAAAATTTATTPKPAATKKPAPTKPPSTKPAKKKTGECTDPLDCQF